MEGKPLRGGPVLLMALSLVATTAKAQPNPDPAASLPAESAKDVEPPKRPSDYDRHLKNGVKLFKDGNWDGAIAEFEAAYRAEPSASPLINLALTYKKIANPAKAIEVLEQAIDRHQDSMAADQLSAARREIEEMNALLAWVEVHVTPAEATLYIDDRRQLPGRAIPLSPGTRTFRAEAPGFQMVTHRVQVTAGRDNAAVELSLVAVMGELVVQARHDQAWIQIDGNPLSRGQWAGNLQPGVHNVSVIFEGDSNVIQVVVEAGGRALVTQTDDGNLQSSAAAPSDTPEERPFGPNVPDVLRGIYGFGGAAILTAAGEPRNFTTIPQDRFGYAGAVHLGYRVAEWAGFEGFAQYSDIRVSGTLNIEGAQGGTFSDVTYVLKTGRGGLMMRVMLPGKAWFRFLGTIGAGVLLEQLQWRGVVPDLDSYHNVDLGVSPFGQMDLGVEFEHNNVLFDLLIQHTLQSTKHFDHETTGANAFDTKPIVVIGPAFRVGYGLW